MRATTASSQPLAAPSLYSPSRAGLICLLLGLLTLALYWPVHSFNFLNYDDPDYVTNNARVYGGLRWENVIWVFTTTHAGNWHPLTWLSHMADCQLFGLHAGPHHLMNLLLHVANTLVLFLVLRTMTGAVWRSALVAALFALHPLHVESVAWVSERKDVLSGFLFLLSLWSYARYTAPQIQADNHRKWRWYALTLLLFALGLMSKPIGLTLPFVLLLLDYWPLQRLQRKPAGGPAWILWPLVREKMPFFALTIASSAITCAAQQHEGAVIPLADVSLTARVGNALIALVTYASRLLWPKDLSILYLHPGVWPQWQVIASAILLLAISAAVLWLRHSRPYLPVGWFWFAGTLVPVLGLVQVGIQSTADRYTYLPSIGFILMLAWAVHDIAVGTRWRTVAGFALAACLCACAFVTTRQLQVWRNTGTLFQHALQINPANYRAWNNLAMYLLQQGKVDEAIEKARQAVQLAPDYDGALATLATGLAGKNKPAEAQACYEHALQCNPSNIDARNNFGAFLARQGSLDEAVTQFSAALALSPDNPGAHFNLGLVLLAKGEYAEAAQHCRATLRVQPRNWDAHYNLGRALLETGEISDAVAQLQLVLQAQPQNLDAKNALGLALAKQGKFDEAISQYTEALNLNSTNAQTHYFLGLALARTRQWQESARHFRCALQLDPKFAAAHYHLGMVCLARQRTAQAMEHWQQAAKLDPTWPDPLNNMAWVLATDPHAENRSGTEAVRLATRATELAGTNDAHLLDTLAAAYAEAGRFTDAISTALNAQAAATRAGSQSTAREIADRISLYRSNRPYHVNPEQE